MYFKNHTINFFFIFFLISLALLPSEDVALANLEQPDCSQIKVEFETVGTVRFQLSVNGAPGDTPTDLLEMSLVDYHSDVTLLPSQYTITNINATTIEVYIDVHALTLEDDYAGYNLTYNYAGCTSQSVTVLIGPGTPDDPDYGD